MNKTKYIKISALGILAALVVNGCSEPQVYRAPVNNDPKWLNDPYINDDQYAAIGCARAHYNGVPGQKKLAVANAIDEIAAQMKTTVENVTLRRKKHTGARLDKLSKDSTSLHTVEKISVQTKIKAYYTKDNGEICAWVIQK